MGETHENVRRFRIIQLERQASIYFNFKEYRDALAVLSNLRQLLSNKDTIETVYFMAMESECHLRLNEDSAAIMVTHDVFQILKTFKVAQKDVNEMADSLKNDRRYVPAYILYYAACKLYISETASDPSSEIKIAFDDMTSMAKEMVESTDDRNVVARHVAPAMKKLVEELVRMPDNGNTEKIEQRAWCYFCVGKCYYYLEDYHQFLTMSEAGVQLMKDKLGGDAEKYRVTGHCYNNAGYAYSSLGHKDKAKAAYLHAINIYEEATNDADVDVRDEDVARARKNLEDVKKELNLTASN